MDQNTVPPPNGKDKKKNGRLSPAFEMKNGTRQGCPLSPLLFVLSLEPLLASVRNSPDVNGIKVDEEEHKLSAFADDVFYIVNPRTSIPNLLKILRKYGDISNFICKQVKQVSLLL